MASARAATDILARPSAPPARRDWLVIVVTATNYPNYPQLARQMEKNEAFGRSFHAVRDVLRGLGTYPEDCLDLYDWSNGPADLFNRIGQFLRERAAAKAARGEPLRDVLFYYVGHGDGKRDHYSLLLRNSNPSAFAETSLRFASLVGFIKETCAEMQKEHRFRVRQFYIIDACFAGRAKYADVSTGHKGAAVPGIAVLCSCNENEESQAQSGQPYTLFTTALLTALCCPDAERERMRTWYPDPDTLLSMVQLRQIINRWLVARTPAGQVVPPTPQVYSLDTAAGDPQDEPLFPNPLASGATEIHWGREDSFGSKGRRHRWLLVAASLGVLAVMLGVAPVVLQAVRRLDNQIVISEPPNEVSWDLTVGDLFTKEEPALPQYAEIPDKRWVVYEQTEIQKTSAVVYRLPYRDDHDEGGPINGANFSYPVFAWHYPNLSISVVNRSKQTLEHIEAVIQVEQVKLDNRVLLVVQDRSYDKLHFRNEGWGQLVNPVVSFRFARASNPPDPARGYEHTVSKPQLFDNEVEVPLEPYVPPELAQKGELPVTGEIAFGPAGATSHVAFATTVLRELPSGRPSLPSFQCHVMLDSRQGADAPPRHIPLHREIKAGDPPERGFIRVGSDRSARYTISVELRSDGGRSLGKKRLILDVFVPRSEAGRSMALRHAG